MAPASPRRRDRSRTLHLQLGQEVIYLLMSIFALASLILALYATQEARPAPPPPAIPDTGKLIADTSKRISDLDKRNTRLLIDIDALKAREKQLLGEIGKLNDKPPIITLEEQQGYKFESGDASLTPAFREKLTREKVPELIRYARTYGVNIIEVIGHTDEVPIGIRSSNLDYLLIPFLQSSPDAETVPQLQATDNAGLGMARAAAVARYLLADPGLRSLKMRILPLSGAQVIDVDDALSSGSDQKEDRNRRRIEIRARRAN